MIRRPPRSTLFPYTRSSDLSAGSRRISPPSRASSPVPYPTSTAPATISSAALTSTYWTRKKTRSEEHTSELQSRQYLVCRLLLEKKKLHEQQTKPFRELLLP